jgi:hypothetical protein
VFIPAMIFIRREPGRGRFALRVFCARAGSTTR